MREVIEGLKGLWQRLKKEPLIVRVKVLVCFIPALILFAITCMGEFAESAGMKMVSWAWRDPRFGKNLAGEKPYCPKEV